MQQLEPKKSCVMSQPPEVGKACAVPMVLGFRSCDAGAGDVLLSPETVHRGAVYACP